MPVQSAAPQTDRKNTALWLHDNGYPILPVAPAQPADQYPARNKDGSIRTDRNGNPVPAFTGKNPSYLDKDGNPHLVNHQKYQAELPTKEEFKVWFANPNNGIGTLGGWNNTVWLDFDTKHFDSVEVFNETIQTYLNTYPHLKESWQEWTHSGGFRLAVRVVTLPTFTNFALTEGAEHVGEALCQGRFTVLAPTVGPSGEPYVCMNRAYPVEVDSLESIGIYPVRKEEPAVRYARPSHKSNAPGGIPLDVLGNDASKEILNGRFDGDRSSALTKACNEWFGWENWAFANKVEFRDSAEDLAYLAGERLGLDKNRVTRILRSIDASGCQPACVSQGGDESAWKRVRKVNKAMFDAVCPQEVKNVIDPSQLDNGAPPLGTADRKDKPPSFKDLSTKDKAQRLRNELDAFLQCEDSREKILERSRICAAYNITKADFTNLLMAFDEETTPKEKTEFTGAELLERFNNKHAINWLIPRFLPVGEAIEIFADPGIGKSVMCIDIAHAVLSGGTFLGESVCPDLKNPKDCKKKVLYITADESEGSTMRKLWLRGTLDVPGFSDRFMMWTAFDITDLKPLEKTLEDFRPDVVIVDSLTGVCEKVGVQEKDPEFARYVYALKKKTTRYCASLAVVHHANKTPLAKGLGKSSGSNRIAAAFWGIYLLDEVKENNQGAEKNENLRWIDAVKYREGNKFKVKTLMNDELDWSKLGCFSVMDDPDKEEDQSTKEKIIRVLKRHADVWLAYEEIARDVSASKSTIYKCLKSLVNSRLVSLKRDEKSKHNVWQYTTFPDVLPPPLPFTYLSDYTDEELDTLPPDFPPEPGEEENLWEGLDSTSRKPSKNNGFKQSETDLKPLQNKDVASTSLNPNDDREGGGQTQNGAKTTSSKTSTFPRTICNPVTQIETDNGTFRIGEYVQVIGWEEITGGYQIEKLGDGLAKLNGRHTVDVNLIIHRQGYF